MSLTDMEGRGRVRFWKKGNKCLALDFQSKVPVLVKSSCVWVSRVMKAYSEWVSSPRGSMGSEVAEDGTLGITDIREEQGCLCKRQERQKRERAK